MQLLLEAIHSCKNQAQLQNLLDTILTHAEKDDLDKRIAIIQELIKGKSTQREIAKNLNVSIFNVSRGANLLKEKSEQLTNIPIFQ